MPMNRVQFQQGLSLPEFMDRYGTEAQCKQAQVAARWPSGLVCPACGVRRHAVAHVVSALGPAVLAVRRLPAPVQRHQWHRLRGHQAAPDALVPGHAVAHPVEEHRLGAEAHVPARGELPHA